MANLPKPLTKYGHLYYYLFILLLSLKSCPLFRDKLFSSTFSVSILMFNSRLSDLRIIPENVILNQSAYTLLI